ncbi:hypothetical protein LshimejAT787_1101620 [Lyophyllum shimeji]|uniref:Uncharacterized protein n=1 Tax=Lyophyllum shimeji TaxID=47721 RepID=A0A9P3URE4_LYOSH|nr:hypothetical protein LshimejAT787_1101620 [Lyophyllum shimeji]
MSNVTYQRSTYVMQVLGAVMHDCHSAPPTFHGLGGVFLAQSCQTFDENGLCSIFMLRAILSSLHPHIPSFIMPETQFQSDEAQLVAVFVECIFYGVYLVTFLAALQSILWTGPERAWLPRLNRNKTMFAVVLLMFTDSSLNLALGLVRILQGLIYSKRSGGGAVEQLGLDWVNIVKPVTVNIQTMVADGVLIYRCWVVYAKSHRVVLLPIVLWFGSLACTAVSMYMQGVLTSGSSRVNGGTLFPVIIGFWSATIALNLYATTMIVIRIWRVVNETAMTHRLFPFCPVQPQSRLQNIMRIIIESGLVYTLSTVIVFATLLSGSNSIFITSAAEIQVIGIAFNLILIRAKSASELATENVDYTAHDIRFASPMTDAITGGTDHLHGILESEADAADDLDVEKNANDSGKSRETGTRPLKQGTSGRTEDDRLESRRRIAPEVAKLHLRQVERYKKAHNFTSLASSKTLKPSQVFKNASHLSFDCPPTADLIMKLSFTLLIPIAALATGASAAECYAQGGSHRCVDGDSMWTFRQWYCTQDFQGNGGSKRYNADNGFSAVISRAGPFSSQQQCWDSSADIINTCMGHKDGGTWTGSSMELNINFCA